MVRENIKQLGLAAVLGPVFLGACHAGGIRDRSPGGGATGADASQDAVNTDGQQVDGADANQPTPISCAVNTDCWAQGLASPHVCRNRVCVDLRTKECPLIFGVDGQQGEPFVVGLVSGVDPLHDPALPLQANVTLALDEFGELGVPVGGELRRPVVLMCKGTDDAHQELNDSLDYLIDGLGVPGIIMWTNHADLYYATQRTLLAGKNVLFLDHGGADLRLRDAEDRGLVWHMLGDPARIAPAFVPLVQRAEESVNPGTSQGTGPPTRLALYVDRSMSFEADTADLLAESLRINGGLAGDQLDGSFRIFVRGGLNPAYDIAPFRPHIVVALSSEWFVYAVLDEMERQIAELGGSPPFYVLSHGATHLPALEERVRLNPMLRTRIVGVNFAAARDPMLYSQYLERLQAMYPGIPNLEGTENHYDMMYLLLYAVAAADPTPPFDGAKLAVGLRRVIDPTGPPFDVGPERMAAVLLRLREPTGTLRLTGTLGPADFDETTGVARTGGSVWCLDANNRYRYDLLRYDQRTGQLEGTFSCYPF
jgi:hypothetical protein